MPKRKYYLFLCTNKRADGHPKGCCMSGGADKVQQRFAEILIRDNLRDRMRLVRTSCLDNCATGPTLAVYPDDVWYQHVQPEDVEEIVESHIKGGRPVERLLLPAKDFG